MDDHSGRHQALYSPRTRRALRLLSRRALLSRRRTAIYANNYGEAGAVDLLGPKYGLPPAICTHQNYFYWGPPAFDGETVIVLQGTRENLEKYFQSVEEAGSHTNPYGMAEEDGPIYLCRGPKFKFVEVWPQLKHWN